MSTVTITDITTTTEGTRAERMLSGAFDAGFVGYMDSDPKARRVLLRSANASYRSFRRVRELSDTARMLTAPGSQPKLMKSDTPSYGMMLTPATGVGDVVRGVNLCPLASAGCRAACLGPTAGKGVIPAIQYARKVRTEFLLTHPTDAGVLIAHELTRAVAKHGQIMFRPNTVSDIRWEIAAPGMVSWVGASDCVTLYDYTAWRPEDRTVPSHYRLTFSHKEDRDIVAARDMVASGRNVAIVVNVKKGAPLPATFLGLPVVDGDKTDDRTTDPAGVWVMLRPKGSAAAHDESGFVVDITATEGMVAA